MTNHSFPFFRMHKAALTIALNSVLLSAVLLVSGCGKKTPIPPPPPPAPAASNGNNVPATSGKPVVADFSVEPSTIERGQSAILRWNVTGSTNVAINNGIGTVQANGNRRIIPADTTTYLLTAMGPAGETTATATVTVTGPAPPPPPSNTNSNSSRGTLESRVQSELRDALYDYDSNNIRDDARAALTADADALKRIMLDFPTATFNVEGHCDERGSAEYNLGLGDRRASSARDFLVQLGVPGDRLKTISYGKERPVCTEADESCWQRNRRAHLSVGQ